MNKQPKVTEATKQAFIDSFCDLCKTTPIEKLTIHELTRKAGYNRCTFYEYFNGVYDLLEYIENELLSRMKANLFETIKSVDDSEKFISSLINLQKGHEKYFDVLFSDSNNSKFAKRLKSVMFPAFMKQFNISGRDVQSRYVLEFHLSGLIAVMTNWIVNGRDIPMPQLGGVIRGILNEGILKMLKKKSDKSIASVVDKPVKQ